MLQSQNSVAIFALRYFKIEGKEVKPQGYGTSDAVRRKKHLNSKAFTVIILRK